MKVTKYGHACLLVDEGEARILLDPGIYTAGFEDLEGITAVLVTHAHPDHLDAERVAVLAQRNPEMVVLCDPGSSAALAAAGVTARTVRAGERIDLGVEVTVHGEWHTRIHPDLEAIPNVAYLVGGILYHPGDALTTPGSDVEVLAVPCGGPWLKLAEAIDYVRAVNPRIALPIHESALARPASHHKYLAELAPAGTTVTVLAEGESLEV